MKKKTTTVVAIVLIIVTCVCVWFVGYYNRKSQDNLPSLETVAQMDEVELNKLLIGYYNYQLADVWEEPDEKNDNTWIWKINEHTQLQVSANNKGKIVTCGLDSVFQAKILEISDGYYLVEPVESSPELKSADKIEVAIEHLDLSLEPRVGDTIKIIHGGEILETYPARLHSVYSIEILIEEKDLSEQDVIDMFYIMTNGEIGLEYLDCTLMPDHTSDRVGAVLFENIEDGTTNIVFFDAEGYAQQCGIYTKAADVPDLTYLGDGVVTFKLETDEHIIYNCTISISIDAGNVEFVITDDLQE